jgi:hypothetical protein
MFTVRQKYLSPRKYIRECKRIAPMLFGPFINAWEKGQINHYGCQPSEHQPIFIIGAPRTGSTILYQALTNLYEVLYVDNLTCRFYMNFFFGFWLSNKIFGNKPNNNYQSDYGNTSKYGLHAPSECGNFWYRWLPKGNHFVDYVDITDKMVEQIRKEVVAVTNYFDKPIIFKNLNAGQRLRLIWKCFPDALFLYIKRDPFFTIQSVLIGRKINNIPADRLWGIKPRNHSDLLALDEISMVTAQVYFLEKQIEKDLQLFKDKNRLVIKYERLVLEPKVELYEIDKFLKLPKKSETTAGPGLFRDRNIVINNDIACQIREKMKEYESE